MEDIASLANSTGSLEEKCREFGAILGLDEPVSKAVLYGALHNPTYAHNLLTCRVEPSMLQHLLQHPPKLAPEQAGLEEKSNLELLKKATEALWKWSKTGFSTVDDATFQKRYNACMQCPNLADAPNKVLYKLAASAKADKICSLCGCMVDKKARIPSEACPSAHPTKPGLTRWEEPISG